MSEGSRWKRRLGEAVMIVVSILLAFWIDAWWVGLEEAEDERESLELVSRDLNAAITQLTEYAEFAERVGTHGVEAVAALSSDDSYDRLELSRMIQRATDRKTVALPAAAYTDLVSTGSLRLIQNRKLRDAIVRYYESAEIAQRILEKNSALFLDKHIYGLYGDGLIMFRTDVPWGHREAQAAAIRDADSRLPDDFDYGPDYFWSLSADSAEWHRLRSSLSVASATLFMGREYALEIIEDARTLDAEVRKALEAR
jgi:hypothetical protein